MTQSQNVDGSAELSALLGAYDGFVTYVALRTEVPFRDYIEIPESAVMYEIPPRASRDPFEEARRAIDAMEGRKVAVLIPGRAFDVTGTRHGQGGGWYDRFLSRIPPEWQRIGFCFRHQFSDAALPRQPWDQVMDAVVVAQKDGTGAVVQCPDRTKSLLG